jgi:hypothetical protein
VTLLLGCDDAVRPTAPQPELKTIAGGEQRQVQMMDACDPQSFNAALGPGTCARQGGVRFAKFLTLLGKHHKVGAWNFAPPTLNVRVGQELLAVNQGGEVHTFTEVEEFGGGFVPDLNALSGEPVPAPEGAGGGCCGTATPRAKNVARSSQPHPPSPQQLRSRSPA